MKCPKCGSEDAYQGFTSVECINSKCENFSEKQLAIKYRDRTIIEDLKVTFYPGRWEIPEVPSSFRSFLDRVAKGR